MKIMAGVGNMDVIINTLQIAPNAIMKLSYGPVNLVVYDLMLVL